MIELFEIFNKVLLTEAVSSEKVLKALRGHNLCIITYESNVPDYPVAPGTRWGVVLAYGIGRYKGEKCMRVYQPYGDSEKGTPGYKIMYLKDVQQFTITPQIQKEAPELFNPNEDRWMVQTLEVAKWKNFTPLAKYRETPKEPEIFKTDTEKEIAIKKQQLQQPARVNLTDKTKTTQDRFKEVKAIANQSLSLYNQARRKGNQEAAERALNAFRSAQTLSNQYMALYKKELNNNSVSQSKTQTERNIEQNK